MIWRITLFRWRFTFSIAPTSKVTGVNSTLQDGNHIIMWDFDDVPLMTVVSRLRDIQAMYQLPQIRIFETKKPKPKLFGITDKSKRKLWKDGEIHGNYIAWCFKRLPFIKALEIVVTTKGVCWGYIKWSVYRKHFTSRVTPKDFRKINLAYVLLSDVPEDVAVEELRSWVHYETLMDGFPMKVIEYGKRDT